MNLMEPLQPVGRCSQTPAALQKSCWPHLPHLLGCSKEKVVLDAGAWYQIAGGISAPQLWGVHSHSWCLPGGRLGGWHVGTVPTGGGLQAVLFGHLLLSQDLFCCVSWPGWL